MLKSNLVMFMGFLGEFKNTGTVFQSSRWAARALTKPIRQGNKPKHILEVGAGTGPVTLEIVRELREGDTLTIVEINPRFMEVLKENLEKLPEYQQHRDKIRFFQGPIQDLQEDREYDVIICALPFLNFDTAVVREIFAKFDRVSRNNLILTYYEYIGMRRLGKVVSKSRKRRLEELESFLEQIGKQCTISRKKVWLNLLPIYIYTFKFSGKMLSNSNRELAA